MLEMGITDVSSVIWRFDSSAPNFPQSGTMRADAAQSCQVRKEATVSGYPLRRGIPGCGFFCFRYILILWLMKLPPQGGALKHLMNWPDRNLWLPRLKVPSKPAGLLTPIFFPDPAAAEKRAQPGLWPAHSTAKKAPRRFPAECVPTARKSAEAQASML